MLLYRPADDCLLSELVDSSLGCCSFFSDFSHSDIGLCRIFYSHFVISTNGFTVFFHLPCLSPFWPSSWNFFTQKRLLYFDCWTNRTTYHNATQVFAILFYIIADDAGGSTLNIFWTEEENIFSLIRFRFISTLYLLSFAILLPTVSFWYIRPLSKAFFLNLSTRLSIYVYIFCDFSRSSAWLCRIFYCRFAILTNVFIVFFFSSSLSVLISVKLMELLYTKVFSENVENSKYQTSV